MINFTGTFVDGYDIAHTDPVFMIAYANLSESTNQQESLDRENLTYISNSDSNIRISYGVIYWTDQGAKDSGARPLEFISNSGLQQMSFSVTSTPADLIAACEAHFTNEYLS